MFSASIRERDSPIDASKKICSVHCLSYHALSISVPIFMHYHLFILWNNGQDDWQIQDILIPWGKKGFKSFKIEILRGQFDKIVAGYLGNLRSFKAGGILERLEENVKRCLHLWSSLKSPYLCFRGASDCACARLFFFAHMPVTYPIWR